MKKMRKALACTLTAAVALSLTACGSSEQGGSSSDTTAAAAAGETTKAAGTEGGQAQAAPSGEQVTVTFWDENAGDEQFEINDSRSLEKMYQDISDEGLQPVLNDYLYV